MLGLTIAQTTISFLAYPKSTRTSPVDPEPLSVPDPPRLHQDVYICAHMLEAGKDGIPFSSSLSWALLLDPYRTQALCHDPPPHTHNMPTCF